MKLIPRAWRVRIALVLAVVGPGFITANVDNDAGGIATYSVAGAQFGYTLLWAMVPITIALVIIQEMSSRMGAVTGKGLSDLIREEFGLRATFLLMLALFVTNFFNIVAEFAGVASAFELFGVPKYIVVPLAALVVWAVVVHGTYGVVEKVFLSASAFYVAYIVSGVFAQPDWKAAALSTVTRPESAGFRNYGYLSMTHRPGRDDDRAVDAVLPAGLDRGKRRDREAVQGVAARRHHRVHLRRRRGLVHHRRLRGDAAYRGRVQHRERGRRREGAASARGRVGVPALCGRPVQRLALRRIDSADFHRVCRLRGSRARVGPRQTIRRSAGILLALHGADRSRRRRRARSRVSRSSA